ncbi:MAG: uncharacterized protein QOJ13_1020 [Gaiellales bacterium]|jgi:uncharacterized membrane protein YfcA|nr:uncharacterized protein [Gaiellales bacterium]
MDLAEAFLAGLIVAAITTPAGVSGAVLLLPVQVSLLGVPSPAVTPTNLLYNLFATPSGVLRYRKAGSGLSDLAWPLLAGTIPGVVLGAVIRVEWLAGERAFEIVVAAVLAPLGAFLLFTRPRTSGILRIPRNALALLAFAVGVVGGIYGIGGGSILAPILLVTGYSAYQVAPAALLSTMAASIVGVASFLVLGWSGADGAVTPEWATGIAAGLGGVIGAFAGASAQPHIPEIALRRLLGALVIGIAVRYVLQAA